MKKDYTLGDNKINDITIHDTIKQVELFEYEIVHRESFIDDLFGWIGEGLRGNRSDVQLMKNDLLMLATWDDEYIFSSISTNKYICKSDDTFIQLCDDLLELNKTIKNN